MTRFSIPGYHLRDHSVSVPLDWAKPEGETITVFAREVVSSAGQGKDLPVLVFL